MLERMPSRLITEYQAYERVAGPLGPARADVQAAIIAATVANANSGKGQPATPADFIPTWDRKPTQTVDEMVQIAYALNAAFGGSVVEGGNSGASE
jgi:hypothetical protein